MTAVSVQPGDFACVPVSGEGGVLIRLGEMLNGSAFSQYQHAEIYVGTSDELLMYRGTRAAIQAATYDAPFGWTFGAYPHGARLVPLPCPAAELPGALWSSGAIPLTGVERHDLVGAALLYDGVGYGWLDYLALASHRLGINDPALKRYIERTKTLICSQLVSHIYTQVGINLFSDGRWEGYVTPADLAGVIHAREV
jgi:hypothetical protein